jgi:hypothetical protein
VEQHLRRVLDELSSAIGRSKHDDQREELTRLHGRVERRLERAEKAEKDEEEHSGLVEALERAEIDLEADHPALAGALRSAINALSSAGI